MGWETRKNFRRYYYRTKRIPCSTRRVREYCGVGVIGELAAQEDAERAAQRKQNKADAESILKDMEADQIIIERFHHETRRIIETQGSHRYHRGEWHKMREAISRNEPPVA